MRWPSGVQARLAVAMVVVAVVSVAVAAIVTTLAVDRTVDRFGREDLALSAQHAAALAAERYTRRDGWSAGDVAELRRVQAIRGHTLVVRDGAGRVAPGSSGAQAAQRALAPVRVGGQTVGEVSLAHITGGYLKLNDDGSRESLGDRLQRELTGTLALSAATAIALGLVIGVALAVALARPVRRLTRAAERIEAGDLDTPVRSEGASEEIRQLGDTLQRVASGLKRQEEVRRETVADVTHELRTPVTGLRGRIEAVQDGVLTDTPALLAAMHGDVLRLSRLIDDLARVAEAHHPRLLLDRSRVDLAALACRRAQAFEAAFRSRGIALFTDVEPASTSADAERLGQVVDNLLSNALRYTDRGGRVVLRVIAGGSESIIEVADTGLGMTAEEIPRIFDRFWRGDRSRARAVAGSGLGLALVRELVAAHGGRVEVESIAGSGSRFRVRLPAGVPRTPAPVRSAHAAPGR